MSYALNGGCEIEAQRRAIDLFHADPMRALMGMELLCEATFPTHSWATRGTHTAVFELAETHRERFLQLVSHLPPLVQDVFLQYCILGRTQAQIAKTLDIRQSPDVWRAFRRGVDAISAILAWGPDPSKMNGHTAAASYRSLLKQEPERKTTSTKYVSEPRNLGNFHIKANDPNLSEFFVHNTQQREHC